MENKIDRTNDDSLYQPKIHSERIRELYRLKEATGGSMTLLLDSSIREFVASYGAPGPLIEEPDLRNVDQETWNEIGEYRRFWMR